jgi:putative phosphoesterase
MLIGIISDTHGKTQRLARAMDIFRDHGVDVLVHCGDIVSEKCVEQLASWPGDVYLVAGNMDRPHLEAIERQADAGGVHFARNFITVPLENDAYLAATHGHLDTMLQEWLELERFEYVCYGHTHRLCDQRVGTTRVLNPGALNNPKEPKHHTVLVLDTLRDTVEELAVD